MCFVILLSKLLQLGVILFIIGRIYSKLYNFQCVSPVCLVGKTAIVVGGSGGIGKEIVLDLLSRGCKVIVGDIDVSDTLKEEFVAKTYNSNIRLEFVNLQSFASIRNFVLNLKKTEEKIDILINNAGVAGMKDKLTEDGLNFVMQTNYYGPVLLTYLLLELLKKSSSPRVLFTSSMLAFTNSVSMKTITFESIARCGGTLSYSNSKFLLIVGVSQMARKLEKCNVACNCWHPCVASTDINRKYEFSVLKFTISMCMKIIIACAGKSVRDAAQTGIHLACSDEVKGITGEFFGEGAPTYKPFLAGDKNLSEAVWRITEEAIKLQPGERIE